MLYASASSIPDLDETTLDQMNKHIEVELQESGIAVTSGTRINGRYVLHLAHCNHRTRSEDFIILVDEVIRLGREYLVTINPDFVL